MTCSPTCSKCGICALSLILEQFSSCKQLIHHEEFVVCCYKVYTWLDLHIVVNIFFFKVQQVTKEFPYCGENLVKQIIRQRGIKVTRAKIRESIHRVDQHGVDSRKRGRLHRRVYDVKGPNHLWHIDTNHKLVRWSFVIIGGIDGYSRLPVMLELYKQ